MITLKPSFCFSISDSYIFELDFFTQMSFFIEFKSYQSVNSFNVDCSVHYRHDHLRSMNFMRASKNVLIHASTIYMQYASIFVALKLCHLPILICSVVVWPTIFLSSHLCILFLFVLFHTSLL